MSNLNQAADRFLEAIAPAAVVKQQAATARVIDLAGGIAGDAVTPHLSPRVLRWGPGDTGRWPIERAGRAVLYRACAEVAPSTGDCVITLSVLTEFAGSTDIATVTIPEGQQFGAEVIAYDFPAGAWIGSVVSVANGASGVSSAVKMRAGE